MSAGLVASPEERSPKIRQALRDVIGEPSAHSRSSDLAHTRSHRLDGRCPRAEIRVRLVKQDSFGAPEGGPNGRPVPCEQVHLPAHVLWYGSGRTDRGAVKLPSEGHDLGSWMNLEGVEFESVAWLGRGELGPSQSAVEIDRKTLAGAELAREQALGLGVQDKTHVVHRELEVEARVHSVGGSSPHVELGNTENGESDGVAEVPSGAIRVGYTDHLPWAGIGLQRVSHQGSSPIDVLWSVQSGSISSNRPPIPRPKKKPYSSVRRRSANAAWCSQTGLSASSRSVPWFPHPPQAHCVSFPMGRVNRSGGTVRAAMARESALRRFEHRVVAAFGGSLTSDERAARWPT